MSALNPIPSASELLRVREAGKDLAMHLVDIADGFRLPPELVPAMLVEALTQATIDLIPPMSTVEESWPGSLTDQQAQLKGLMLQVLNAGGVK